MRLSRRYRKIGSNTPPKKCAVNQRNTQTTNKRLTPMAQKRLFVFTAGNSAARAHLDDSIRNPVDLDRALAHFSGDDKEQIRAIAEHGLYAWGAIPGPQNTPRWEAMQSGDWVLCVFEHRYR